MIKFPSLKNGKKKVKSYVLRFGGVNNTNDYHDGELENSLNLDADALPYLAAGHKDVSQNIPADDLLYADGIARVILQDDGQNYLYFRPEKDGTSWNSYPVVLTEGKKEIASAGGKILVMPDKMVLDMTAKYPAWKTIEKELTCAEQTIKFYGNYMVFKNAADFSSFTDSFKVGDVVTLTSGYYEGNSIARWWFDKKAIIREISKASEKKVIFDPYTFENTSGNDSIESTFKKTIPTLTCICSWNDRVWGCSSDGKIWASKYQDPTNFEYFDLTSADSFALDAGMGGAFTGSCATGSYVAFFRQNKIHRITGTKPSNYRHTVIKKTGVLKGAERSLAVIGDIIYYEGKDGFYAFDGGDAHLISEKLGKFTHSLGTAAVSRGNYYVSVKGSGESHEAYIYYPRKGIWLKNGLKEYRSAVNFLGDMYYIDKNEKVIYKVSNTKGTKNFNVTLCALKTDFAEKKGYLRICIGYTKEKSGNVYCSTSINGESFSTVYEFTDGGEGVGEVRLTPNRGDTIKLRIGGTHDAVVKYVMYEYHSHGSVF